MLVVTIIRKRGKNARFIAYSPLGRTIVTGIAYGAMREKGNA